MRHRRTLVAVALVIALVAATSPLWRVLMLGTEPTLDELMQLRCSAAT
jgi:hypothetical protein